MHPLHACMYEKSYYYRERLVKTEASDVLLSPPTLMGEKCIRNL